MLNITHDKYENYFPETLFPHVESQYEEDIVGSPGWIISTKIPFSVLLDGLRTTEATDITIFIDYYDNQDGYIQIEYDNNGEVVLRTLATYTNSETWKRKTFSYKGCINNIFEDGDFQIFSSTTNNSSVNLDTTIRRVGLYTKKKNVVATWQALGVEPVTLSTLGGSSRDSTYTISLREPSELIYYQGMKCVTSNNASTIPIYFKVVDDDTYWQDSGGRQSTIELTYFDDGTDDIHVSYYEDGIEETKLLFTKTDTQRWITATKTIGYINGYRVYNMISDTTNLNDTLIDIDELSTYPNTSYNPSHANTEILAPCGGVSYFYHPSNHSFYPEFADSNDVDGFNVGSEAFTFSTWMRTSDNDNNYIINDYYNGSGYKLLRMNTGELQVQNYDNGQDSYLGIGSPVLDSLTEWHHVAFGSDGAGTLHAWVDGTEHATLSYTTLDPPMNATHFRFFDGFFSGYTQDIWFHRGHLVWNTDTFTPPTMFMKDYVISLSGSIGYLGEYVSNGSDIKFSTDGSALQIAKIKLTAENNAYLQWEA